jgi:hypothetical protein
MIRMILAPTPWVSVAWLAWGGGAHAGAVLGSLADLSRPNDLTLRQRLPELRQPSVRDLSAGQIKCRATVSPPMDVTIR